MTDWDGFPHFLTDAGTSPREAGSGVASGLLEAMWLPFLPDHGWAAI